MCAINGFNFKDELLVTKMNRVTKHRGPDGSGVFLDEKISLGHNRLSIIDVSDRANQPMFNGDENLAIVFNGEIYNFRELKKELQDYNFKTESDTEVILASYQKWGKNCVKKFNGIFAFAIWDKEKEELFLARDQVGVKPLYYFWDGKKFIFSSEIKGILEHNVLRVLNKEAFNHYLRVLYVPAPFTMFEGICKFPPASFAVLKNEKLNIEKYWELGENKKLSLSKKEIIKKLKEKILNSVKSQLVSDRPIGIYLSGGIDSSVVLHNVSKLRDKIDTFSVGFELSEAEENEKFNADFNLAKKTSNYYGTNHHEVILKSGDVVKLFEKVVWNLDEPISNATCIAQMALAEFAKKSVDVVLSGDGGDELFGGYERYRLSLFASYYQKIPSVIRHLLNKHPKLKKLNTPSGIKRFALFFFQKNEILERTINKNIFDKNISHDFFDKMFFKKNDKKPFEEIFMDTDRKGWLVDESLMKTDKMSMAYGLEARVPLLDVNLVEFARTIPLKFKLNLFDTKIILKKAYKKDLPEFLFNQPKRGWFSPGAKWLRHPEIYKMAQEVLSENYYSETKNLFNWIEIKKILEDHYNKKEYNLTVIWAILTFQLWAKRYNIKL
ncbi:asparagine synthase (glutamine-hydrolyzing) [Patescibacteria group bacterium]|nr:asparagine synthase (glutamine-hydrolyzing) [Patescibacteria group bacterium]MCG2694870.1 asparagine synthase (glutamine-hydrolyzing) [Candidatus Parcubacteria bacterium]